MFSIFAKIFEQSLNISTNRLTNTVSHQEGDNKGQIDVIYTDFSSAFDTVKREILLSKLCSFGSSPSLLRFMRSYLVNRVNCVSYKDYESSVFTASSSVPQGSNLGPLY